MPGNLDYIARVSDDPHTPVNQSAPDPEQWLADHGDALFRYALLHVADRSVAEDLVQETLLGALKARESFAGRSSTRTWLTGILKHKICDHVRRKTRRQPEEDLAAADELIADQFNQHGLWSGGPRKWRGDPSSAFDNAEFWDVLTRCLEALPERLRAAFAQREIEATPTEEICKLLDVTATNLWTLLHRARTRLRACLERNWFRSTD